MSTLGLRFPSYVGTIEQRHVAINYLSTNRPSIQVRQESMEKLVQNCNASLQRIKDDVAARGHYWQPGTTLLAADGPLKEPEVRVTALGLGINRTNDLGFADEGWNEDSYLNDEDEDENQVLEAGSWVDFEIRSSQGSICQEYERSEFDRDIKDPKTTTVGFADDDDSSIAHNGRDNISKGDGHRDAKRKYPKEKAVFSCLPGSGFKKFIGRVGTFVRRTAGMPCRTREVKGRRVKDLDA